MADSVISTAMIQAFTTMRTLLGGGVEVSCGDHSTMAIVRYGADVEFDPRGTKNVVTGNVRALYSELGDVSLTQTVTVGGVKVFVSSNPIRSTDGSSIVFDFTSFKPVEG